MAIQKNQIIPLEITSLSNDGNGVGHYDGMAVFVSGAVVGDTLDVRLVKICKSYAFGIIERIVAPSAHRIESDCAVCKSCGGCDFRTMTYEAELAAKQGFVQDAMKRLGGLDITVEAILPSPSENGYRNKVQYPVARLGDGKVTAEGKCGKTMIFQIFCRLRDRVIRRNTAVAELLQFRYVK